MACSGARRLPSGSRSVSRGALPEIYERGANRSLTGALQGSQGRLVELAITRLRIVRAPATSQTSVDVVHWDPRAPIYKGRLRLGQRINNFGDLLGPVIVGRVLERNGILPKRRRGRARRLLAVGSILRLAREGDTLWGIGANGKSLDAEFKFHDLDVRAVRGPRTRQFLTQRGIHVPEVYGDPGLLLSHLWKREDVTQNAVKRDVVIIPNFHDISAVSPRDGLVNPRTALWDVIGAISASKLVVGSSLHAIVIAESFGIPARLVRSGSEAAFKYQDYYEGTGRDGFEAAPTIDEAIRMGGEAPMDWDPAALLNAFPFDLWQPAAPLTTSANISTAAHRASAGTTARRTG